MSAFTPSPRHILTLLLMCFTLWGCPPRENPSNIDERCDDGIDNNEDGKIDCEDAACAVFPTCTGSEHCYNSVDDDGDGKVDCEDEACAATFLCQPDIEDCANGRDDDQDGDIDCEDSACATTSVCQPGAEACTGGVDEDQDGDIDCDDEDCKAVFICLVTFELPDNGLDDDGDGQIDCLDDDIARTSECLDGGEQCDNGVDDDGDGAADCADVDCSFTRTCLTAVESCSNGFDDNGDGLTDCEDPACQVRGLCAVENCFLYTGDEDGDGLTNCDDPDCDYAWTCLLPFEPPTCPRDANGAPDCMNMACAMEPECQPMLGEEVCDDGIDNDQDGLTDCEDAVDCVEKFVDDDDAHCIVELCGDENGVVRSGGQSEPIFIFSDADLQREFPEQSGPTLWRGTIIMGTPNGGPRYTPGANSLRCILPASDGGPGVLVIEDDALTQDFSGFESLRVVEGISLTLWDGFQGFDGLTALTHVLGEVFIEEDFLAVKPTTTFSFAGFDSLKTLGEGFRYSKKVEFGMDEEIVTRTFSFDGLGALVEVRGHLLNLEPDASQTDPCYWIENLDEIPRENKGQVGGTFFAVDDFVGLESLRRIGGDLCVAPTENFSAFDELEQLEQIGGDFMVNWPDAPEGATVTDTLRFDGLISLREVQGHFAIARGDLFAAGDTCRFTTESYIGLQNLERVGGLMSLCLPQSFTGFDAFSSLTEINEHFYIFGESGPSTIPGDPMLAFTSLTRIGGTLLISDTGIDTLDGLESLTELGGLELYGNPQLNDLTALQGITELSTGHLHLDSRLGAVLDNAVGLENLTSVAGNVELFDNQNFMLAVRNIETIGGKIWLDQINTLTDLDDFANLTSYQGLALVSLGNLQNLNGLPLSSTLDGGITLYNMPESTNYDRLTAITSLGDYLRIEDNTWSSLPSFALQSLGGDLEIRLTGLGDLTGLDSLTTIGGSIFIESNSTMQDLTGLNNVTTALNITIENNMSMTSLTGLDSIDSVPGNIELKGLAIDTLTGLGALQNVGDLFIIDNGALTNLTGMTTLTTVSGQLYMENNRSLTDLSGLESITQTGGLYLGQQDPSLASLNGLQNLTQIDGSLTIEFTTGLSNISDLVGLTTITGDLVLRDNEQLADIDGLMNLRDLGGALMINNHPNLPTVDPLLGVTRFGGDLVEITGNTPMDDCNADNLATHLESVHTDDMPSVTRFISGNETCL